MKSAATPSRDCFPPMQRMARVAATSMVVLFAFLSAGAVAECSVSTLHPISGLLGASDADLPDDGDSAIAFVRKAFDTTDFQPRWQSENWSAGHAWLHIVSDLGASLAYLLMAGGLANLCRKRPGIPYAKLFWLFTLFIFAGGIVHLLDALMFWWPAYRLTGLAKASAALISLITAAALLPLGPRAMTLRSPAELQREIAQRRRTELELRQVHAELEGVIELRTAELASKNEEMEQFLNTVSHDLKSPIVTCLGLAGMLREDIQAGRIEETKETVTRIERSATRMRQLIEDLLNLSRIGKVRFEVTDVDTRSVIRAICDEYKPRLEKIGAVMEIDSDLPTVRADARWLTEVFENLITNAMKYGCDNPHPRITIGSVFGDKEHRFYVRDNGSGIDPAHHAQILQPFRRLRTDKEGSGMGLAIVVRIIKMHGGRLWIESQPGQGATFWVALPAAVAGVSGDIPQSEHVEKHQSSLIGDRHESSL
jgi:two-component system, chemotaxis family, sensor kinase Cph1